MKYLILLMITFLCNQINAQFISKENALEDLNSFKNIMENESSYYQLTNEDFSKSYHLIKKNIQEKDSIAISYLAYEFEKIISTTIDRHASVRMQDFDKSSYENLNYYFPFIVAPFNGKVIALQKDDKTKNYIYFSSKYPYLKKVNGLEVKEFLNKYSYRTQTSPDRAKLEEGLRNLKSIGELYFKMNEEVPNPITITLTNGTKDKTIVLPLSKEKHHWIAKGSYRYSDIQYKMAMDEKFDFNKLDKWLQDSIAYIGIPQMISYNTYPDFPNYLEATIDKYQTSTALIIDLRGNGGGTRDILNTLSKYFIQPNQSPWVANVAYVRSDQNLDEDISSMESRYLYNYNSSELTTKDRQSIDAFNESFFLKSAFNKDKFSEPFYMVLKSGDKPLNCPVYLLVNEECFSATSVFTSAFKGIENVTIVGVTTNGSSGRSKKFILENSNIRIKISTMLSFQRDGRTLDGVGTEPDIEIEPELNQVFGVKDTQLEKLIQQINNKN